MAEYNHFIQVFWESCSSAGFNSVSVFSAARPFRFKTTRLRFRGRLSQCYKSKKVVLSGVVHQSQWGSTLNNCLRWIYSLCVCVSVCVRKKRCIFATNRVLCHEGDCLKLAQWRNHVYLELPPWFIIECWTFDIRLYKTLKLHRDSLHYESPVNAVIWVDAVMEISFNALYRQYNRIFSIPLRSLGRPMPELFRQQDLWLERGCLATRRLLSPLTGPISVANLHDGPEGKEPGTEAFKK